MYAINGHSLIISESKKLILESVVIKGILLFWTFTQAIAQPGTYPSDAPSKSCNFNSVQITRLGDPFDNEDGQIIELFFADTTNCKNVEITEPISLLFDAPSSTTPMRRTLQQRRLFDISGETINENGIISFCQSISPYDNCIEPPGGMFPPPSGTVCVCNGPPSTCTILDIYGYGGCSGSRRIMRKLQHIDTSYRTGQAERIRLNKPEEKGIFVEDNWKITKNVTAADIEKSTGTWSPNYTTSLVITEVFSANNLFFIELFAPYEKDRGARYSEELKFVRFLNGNEEPDWDLAITINRIPHDGFIVICNKPASEYWGGSCTDVIKDFGPSIEAMSFALIIGFKDLGHSLIDIVRKSSTSGFVGKIIMHFTSDFKL